MRALLRRMRSMRTEEQRQIPGWECQLWDEVFGQAREKPTKTKVYALAQAVQEAGGWVVEPGLLQILRYPVKPRTEAVFMPIDTWERTLELITRPLIRTLASPVGWDAERLVLHPHVWAVIREDWTRRYLLIGKRAAFALLPGLRSEDLALCVRPLIEEDLFATAPRASTDDFVVPVHPHPKDSLKAFDLACHSATEGGPPVPPYWIVQSEDGASLYCPRPLSTRAWFGEPMNCVTIQSPAPSSPWSFLADLTSVRNMDTMREELEQDLS